MALLLAALCVFAVHSHTLKRRLRETNTAYLSTKVEDGQRRSFRPDAPVLPYAGGQPGEESVAWNDGRTSGVTAMNMERVVTRYV